MSTQRRGTGERGLAVIMTGLLLIPLMTFAAFGVDLASWYSRISYLQKSADAASLAGTVWMPDLGKASIEATASLRANGIVSGVDGMVVVITRGATATSLRVQVTDTDADRVFSQVFRGKQSLTRFAEAEYNVPLPLGSPLNYFGGDDTSTAVPDVTTYSVLWPTPYDGSRRPAVAQAGDVAQGFTCTVGTGIVEQAFGRWTNATTYEAGNHTGGTRCLYTVTPTIGTGTVASPPPDYSIRQPTNAGGAGCRVRTNGNADPFLGRWSGTTFTVTGANSGSACTWTRVTTTPSSIPSFAGVQTPTNRPCRVGYEATGAAGGWWPASGGYDPTANTPPVGGSAASGNRLCRWPAQIQTTVTSTPNPIPVDRSPGFWAMIYGPGQYAANGDAFSSRCLDEYNCGTDENREYVPTANPDRGFWYVIDVPLTVSGPMDINVFDAAHNIGAAQLMDSTENGGTPGVDADFETEFRVFKQTNPLDFTARTNVFTGSSGTQSTANGQCWWELRNQAGFHRQWSKLCGIANVTGGDRYLVNVRTNAVSGSANGAGNNGYAIEAVLNGDRDASPGPSIYAYGSMGLANQNICPPPAASGCTPPSGTFYLAKIGDQYRGKSLVIELFDSGDMSGSTNAYIYPMKPSATAPKPVVGVNPLECNWTATPDPNPVQNPGFENARTRTGVRIETLQQAPNAVDGSRCGVQTTIGGTRQFNGEWLRIRVQIPATYDCDETVNDPENVENSCWWGMRYEFANGGASDVTTWSARIEGNPVHLTE